MFRHIVLTAAALMLAGHAAAADPAYRLVKSVALGAPDRWDYLTYDPLGHRVYIAHSDKVTVVDGVSGALIGDITGIPGGTHGIAISHATNQGYTDDGKAGEVVVFDPKTLKIMQRIKAQLDADGMVLDPVTGHLFVVDGDSAKVTVVDPKTDKVIATIDGGGGLEAPVAGDNGKVYVNGVERHDIVVIDTKTNKVEAHWPMTDCERPHGIAIDTAHHRLFSTCVNGKMALISTETGQIASLFPIGKGSDAAGFDPKHQRALSSNGIGTLSVIHEITPDNYEVLDPVKTQLGARTMTLDPETGRVFLVAADMVENPAAAPTDYRNRYKITPGTTKLLIFDPAP